MVTAGSRWYPFPATTLFFQLSGVHGWKNDGVTLNPDFSDPRLNARFAQDSWISSEGVMWSIFRLQHTVCGLVASQRAGPSLLGLLVNLVPQALEVA